MIEVSQLYKNYGEVKAVNGIDFEVREGDVLGFLGPNGAGKSTTMKMITCFLEPTSGEIKVDNFSVKSNAIEVKRNIGYMPENAPLYDEMSVRDFLLFVAELRNIPEKEIGLSINRVVDSCALNSVIDKKIETLSKGFRRRVSLAQALIHDPKVLVLDEPTDGLDPNQKHDVRCLIRSLSKEKCIVLSTHILEEVEALCNRVIIVSEGEKKYDGTPAEMKGKSTSGKIDDVFRAMTTAETVEGVSL